MKKDEIQQAIEKHIENGNRIDNHEELVELILDYISGEAADDFEYKGWRVKRTEDSRLKTRGAAKNYYGWMATHIESGHTEMFPPQSHNHASIAEVKLGLDIKTEMWENSANLFNSEE